MTMKSSANSAAQTSSATPSTNPIAAVCGISLENLMTTPTPSSTGECCRINPVQVKLPMFWRRFNVGLVMMFALVLFGKTCFAQTQGGTVVAWAWDPFGQIDAPLGATNLISVTAGGNHSLALKADGTVVCWGDNGDGESVPPSGLSNVVAIAAGAYHS